jgi:dehydrogenase/reductase SDR family protein 1
VGTAGQNILHGQVCLLTGGTQGVGKGICQELARAGAIVYVTGHSKTDATDKGSVKETAAQLNKLGGQGVAVYADHAQMDDNKMVVDLIEKQHGKLDLLVNNAFFTPKPDKVAFASRISNQPMRFLNEQILVDAHNHAAMTTLLVGALRRGKGLVVNISSWGSVMNSPAVPTSYLTSKAAFDAATYALNETLRLQYSICSISLWPGNVRSERANLIHKKGGDRQNDYETPRFTGRAVVGMLDMDAEEMMAYAKSGTILVSDFNIDKYGGYDIDGYMHEKKLLPYFDQRPNGTMYPPGSFTSMPQS